MSKKINCNFCDLPAIPSDIVLMCTTSDDGVSYYKLTGKEARAALIRYVYYFEHTFHANVQNTEEIKEEFSLMRKKVNEIFEASRNGNLKVWIS